MLTADTVGPFDSRKKNFPSLHHACTSRTACFSSRVYLGRLPTGVKRSFVCTFWGGKVGLMYLAVNGFFALHPAIQLSPVSLVRLLYDPRCVVVMSESRGSWLSQRGHLTPWRRLWDRHRGFFDVTGIPMIALTVLQEDCSVGFIFSFKTIFLSLTPCFRHAEWQFWHEQFSLDHFYCLHNYIESSFILVSRAILFYKLGYF